MLHLVAHAATKKSHAQKNVFTRSATNTTVGTLKTNVLSFGIPITAKLIRAKAFVFSRCLTGLSLIFGNTFTKKTSTWYRLYLAKERPVVDRDGTLIMVDDERMPLNEGEVPQMKSVRFRTLGCYPLTGAVESTASTLTEIIEEMLLSTSSEREGRVIDHDSAGSMEKKKREGYF